ncbi:MAG: hypothetical protein FJ303_25905 [Planctomycetes bacterium]|nr:hypothetical protein [Planctomycetota bacterium]
MRYHSLFAFVLLATTGCALPADEWGIVDAVWNTFPWWSVVWRITLWSIGGGVVGLLVGILLTRQLSNWGAYALPWPSVTFWLQVLLYILNILAMPILFGAIGFFEGVYRAADVALRWSVVGQKWLPPVADVGADAIAAADAWLGNRGDAWDAIRKNRRPVNIVRLVDGLDKLDDEVAERISAAARKDLLEQQPDWKDSNTERAADWMLKQLVRYLLNRQLRTKLAEFGVQDVLGEMRKKARQDGGEHMTHAQLSTFLVENVMIPMLLYPVKHWTSGSQWTAIVIIVVWFAIPLLLIWPVRWLASSPTQPDAGTTSGGPS